MAIIEWEKLRPLVPNPPPKIPGSTHHFYFKRNGTEDDVCVVFNGAKSGPKVYIDRRGKLDFCPSPLRAFSTFPWN